MTSGVVLATLLVNATTIGMLVHTLGSTKRRPLTATWKPWHG